MEDEFDTVAEWTAQVAADLGPEYFIPAACRGSGQPAALDWLLAGLRPRPGDLLIDVGAGVGGPAAYAAERTGVRPVLVEPEPGACRAAARLFGAPVVQADATALPFPDAAADLAWSLGVLCTARRPAVPARHAAGDAPRDAARRPDRPARLPGHHAGAGRSAGGQPLPDPRPAARPGRRRGPRVLRRAAGQRPAGGVPGVAGPHRRGRARTAAPVRRTRRSWRRPPSRATGSATCSARASSPAS